MITSKRPPPLLPTLFLETGCLTASGESDLNLCRGKNVLVVMWDYDQCLSMLWSNEYEADVTSFAVNLFQYFILKYDIDVVQLRSFSNRLSVFYNKYVQSKPAIHIENKQEKQDKKNIVSLQMAKQKLKTGFTFRKCTEATIVADADFVLADYTAMQLYTGGDERMLDILRPFLPPGAQSGQMEGDATSDEFKSATATIRKRASTPDFKSNLAERAFAEAETIAKTAATVRVLFLDDKFENLEAAYQKHQLMKPKGVKMEMFPFHGTNMIVAKRLNLPYEEYLANLSCNKKILPQYKELYEVVMGYEPLKEPVESLEKPFLFRPLPTDEYPLTGT